MKHTPGRLELLRLRSSYSPKEIASHLHVSVRTYLRYEKNIHLVSQRNLLILSYLYKTRVYDMFDEDDPVRLLTYNIFLSPERPLQNINKVKAHAGDKNMNLSLSPKKRLMRVSRYYEKQLYKDFNYRGDADFRCIAEILTQQLKILEYFEN